MRPSSSPRWAGPRGSTSSSTSSSSGAQGGATPTSSLRGGISAGPSSRRAGTHPASSPRALSVALGSTAKPGSARDQQQQGYSRGTAAAAAAAVADAREWSQSGSGSGGKAPKAVTAGMDYKEDSRQDAREDSGRIRVAVRVRRDYCTYAHAERKHGYSDSMYNTRFLVGFKASLLCSKI